MGILIKKSEKSSNLVFNDKIDFISEEFFQMLKLIVELKYKLDNLEKTLEQKQIDSETKKAINSKEEIFKNSNEKMNVNIILEANNNLNKLTGRLRMLDNKMLVISNNLRYNAKMLLRLSCEKEELKEKIKTLKALFKEEIKKINWNKINNTSIYLSSLFENVKNERLKQLLKKIIRKNIELEKLIVKLIFKTSNRLINNDKSQKLPSMVNEIDILISTNEKIYEFIFNLISKNNLSLEVIKLLKQLDNLLDHIEVYAKTSLCKDKTLDISSAIKGIKDISELRRKTIIKSCRPAIFNKKKLEDYQTIIVK